jgi:hypothetical protein
MTTEKEPCELIAAKVETLLKLREQERRERL